MTTFPRRALPGWSAFAAAALGCGLVWAGGHAGPPKVDPKAEPKAYTWPELPKKGQIDKVTVTRVAAKPGEPKSLNAELAFVLGAEAMPFVPALAKTGAQAGPTKENQLPPRRMEVNFDQLIRDRDRYVADVNKSMGVENYAGGRSRRVSATGDINMPKAEGKALDQFPLGKPVVLEPYFRGIPDAAISLAERKTIVANSLMITGLEVVNNERARGTGKWSFGHLMSQLANETETGIRPAEFAKRWLEHWEKDVTVGGFTVPNRKVGVQKFLEKWAKLPNGDLDLSKAPFRLTAITSRLDLRNNFVLGSERIGGGGAGEGRFVFCATLGDGSLEASPPLLFTAIFEFQVKKSDFEGVRAWGEQWYNLSKLKLGSEPYLKALEAITDQFSGADSDPENPPNRSALAALRTNEIALDLLAAAAGEPFAGTAPEVGKPAVLWELREFRIATHSTGYLEQVTVKQTPHLKFDNSARLGEFVNGREDRVLAKAHRTPPEFPAGRPFLDGSSLTPVNQFWKFGDPNTPAKPAIQSGEARHLFSLGTCSGCHAGEAFTKQENFQGDDLSLDQTPPLFMHVRARQLGKAARVSDFLKGDGEDGDFFLKDPAGFKDGSAEIKSRPFGDLRRRTDDLFSLVHYGWHYELHRLPIQFVH